MLKNIYLENFKCFDEIHLELSKLNVLSGINSMGKSTIIQSQTVDKARINFVDFGLFR